MAKRKKRKPEPIKEPSAAFYLTTYSDVMTLLLCLFVLLFSMSSTQEESFKDLTESLQSALGIYSVPRLGSKNNTVEREKLQEDETSEASEQTQKKVKEIVSEIQDVIVSNKLIGDVEVKETPYDVIIRIFDNALFNSGESTLLPESEYILDRVAGILKKFSYRISVEGHTDNVGSNSIQNWRLSSLRACSVLNFLIQKGLDPNYLSIKGYGEYKPVANNESIEGRAKNRRVEIIYNRNDIARAISKKSYR